MEYVKKKLSDEFLTWLKQDDAKFFDALKLKIEKWERLEKKVKESASTS